MNWCEERFVKLFARDTPTWLAWPWQARALAPLLMRKLESDGRLATGRLDVESAVALTVGLPIEVVSEALTAMLEDGTLEQRIDGLWWPNYEEAQESRKSDALRQREHRSKQRLESSAQHRHMPSHAVTQSHTPSPSRTEQTRPDQKKPMSSEGLEPKPRKQSAQQEFFAWSQASAKESNPAFLASAPPKPALLNAQLKTYIETIGRQGLESAWGEYKKDQYATAQGLPWGLFVSKISELHNKTKARPQQTKARVVTAGEDIYATPGDQI